LPVIRAGQQFLERRSRGAAGRVDTWCAEADAVRPLVARLVNATPEEIAFLSNTSEGTNIVAAAIDWRPGDNVVCDDLDHPTNLLIWRHYELAHEVEVRVVPNRGGAVEARDLARAVDDHTRVVSISLVAPNTGYLHDARALSNIAHARGAWLHVDAAQALGAIPVDVRASGIDCLTAGTYKWLLGPTGLAAI
jgi:selenocysteine lyase/cysteine desulfurase